MECICKDGYGVGKVTSNKFDGHEEEGHACDFDKFFADLFVLFIHRNLFMNKITTA